MQAVAERLAIEHCRRCMRLTDSEAVRAHAVGQGMARLDGLDLVPEPLRPAFALEKRRDVCLARLTFS